MLVQGDLIRSFSGGIVLLVRRREKGRGGECIVLDHESIEKAHTLRSVLDPRIQGG
jgi:hypothetical protein